MYYVKRPILLSILLKEDMIIALPEGNFALFHHTSYLFLYDKDIVVFSLEWTWISKWAIVVDIFRKLNVL